MVLSGTVFVYSAASGTPMWGYDFPGFTWIGVFAKWLIVNAFATVPVLMLKACKYSRNVVFAFGVFVYSILGANVIWTLFDFKYGMEDGNNHIVKIINQCCGVSLTVSLIIHCIALCRHGRDLIVVAGGFPYGFGTTFPWLACYTCWNALFIAKITIGGTLQDILFWVLMFAYQCMDRKQPYIELYFFFARPVQLGSYIAFTEWMGTFVPYFYEATTLNDHQPLPVNSHAYFLFICIMNLIFSLLPLYWACQRLVFGLNDFEDRYISVEGVDVYDKQILADEDFDEYDEEDEEESTCSTM